MASERQWQGCTLVNPLCPDDLCDLPPHHEGTEEGIHRLSTFIHPMEVASDMEMVWYVVGSHREIPTNLDEQDLRRLGHELAVELWPEEFYG